MVRKSGQFNWSLTGTPSLFRGNVRQDGVLLRNGRQLFEELGEDDGGEDFGLIRGDGFGSGLLRRRLPAPAPVCKHHHGPSR